MIMEVVEENPLHIYTDARVTLASKNNVGRPKKKSEIKFSPQPKSIISILLSKQESEKDDSVLIDKQMELSVKEKEAIQEDIIKGVLNGSDTKKSVVFQKNKLYECIHVNCTYSTNFPSNLKTHKRIHTSEQLYICDECTFRTKFISSLKTHKRLHTDERPFACDHCEYRCNSRSNLKKHIARKHTKIDTNK